MRVVGLPKSFYQLSKTTPQELTPEAQERMRWVSCWQTLRQQGLTSSAATQALGLPRSTLYRWHKSLREEGPAGLGTKSRRPLRVRGPTWSADLSQAVHKLREGYPRWGKDKLAILLRRQGWQVSNLYDGSDPDQAESPRRTQGALRDTGYRHGVARVGAPMRCASPGSTWP